jgi:glycine/D-amino acid oxidase-like deaminating enzyme
VGLSGGRGDNKLILEQLSGVKGAKACLSCTAGHVWPYKMVMHLLQVVVDKGANLQTTTSVTSVSSFPDSNGCWTVTTPRGSIKATKVVFATNAYTSSLLPQFADKIVPVRGICSYIKPPTTNPAPFLPYTYSIRHGPGLYDYLIPRRDGSIVVGGAKSRFWGDRTWWYGVSNDSEMIEPARDYFDGLMQRTFRGWEGNDAVTGRVWTGSKFPSSPLLSYCAICYMDRD